MVFKFSRVYWYDIECYFATTSKRTMIRPLIMSHVLLPICHCGGLVWVSGWVATSVSKHSGVVLWVHCHPSVLGAGAFVAHHPPVISVTSHGKSYVPAAVWSSSPTVILLVTFMVRHPPVITAISCSGSSTHAAVWLSLPTVVPLVGPLASLVPVIVSISVSGDEAGMAVVLGQPLNYLLKA